MQAISALLRRSSKKAEAAVQGIRLVDDPPLTKTGIPQDPPLADFHPAIVATTTLMDKKRR